MWFFSKWLTSRLLELIGIGANSLKMECNQIWFLTVNWLSLSMTCFDQNYCLNPCFSFINYFKHVKINFRKVNFILKKRSAIKYDFWQGGERGLAIFRFFWPGVDQGWYANFWLWIKRGGRGVCNPPFMADIICEQPLTIKYLDNSKNIVSTIGQLDRALSND